MNRIRYLQASFPKKGDSEDDFIQVIIEYFSLALTAEAVRRQYVEIRLC